MTNTDHRIDYSVVTKYSLTTPWAITLRVNQAKCSVTGTGFGPLWKMIAPLKMVAAICLNEESGYLGIMITLPDMRKKFRSYSPLVSSWVFLVFVAHVGPEI